MIKEEIAPKIGWIVIFLAVVFTLINFVLGLARGMATTPGELGVSGGIGFGLAPVIMALILVGAFQIGKGFRNRRSRVKIYTWTQFAFLIIAVLQILQGAALFLVGS